MMNCEMRERQGERSRSTSGAVKLNSPLVWRSLSDETGSLLLGKYEYLKTVQ